MNNNVQHGNKAKVNSKKSILPQYLTNTLTPKKVQNSNVSPNTIKENAIYAKEYVDDNHK